MKFCRFVPLSDAAQGEGLRYGIIEDARISEISAAPWTPWEVTGRLASLDSVRLLAPVEPRKIVCVGRNYAAHAAELGNDVPKEPLIFLKPPTSLIGPNEAIVLPKYSQRVEHEGELGMVIGRKCAHLDDREEPLNYVLSYTCVNDVTARDLQKSDVQFTRAKGFDTFCPCVPVIAIGLRLDDLAVETFVNGRRRQSSPVSRMIFGVAELVCFVSGVMTLLPGDLLATGTPEGVGPLHPDDEVTVSID